MLVTAAPIGAGSDAGGRQLAAGLLSGGQPVFPRFDPSVPAPGGAGRG